jgi:hypothetical protein
MTSQSLFGFEQEILDTELAAANARLQAKLAARAQREILKRQAELDKNRRRFKRETIRKQKTDDEVAVCGIRFYSRSPHARACGNYWRNCHSCGKPLRYFDTHAEAQANNRPCIRD